jgi:hypothetical protein
MILEYFNIEELINPNSFCNNSFTWKELCGVGQTNSSREHQRDSTNMYYWIEKITFELLVLNKQRITESRMSVDEVMDLFRQHRLFYYDILHKQVKEFIEDDFKLGVCTNCIFLNIKEDKRLWFQVKKEHDLFNLKKSLDKSLETKESYRKSIKC